MTFWFFALGLPLLVYGAASLLRADLVARFLLAFPRDRRAGWALCAAGWFWTAYEVDTIGIDVFDRIVRRLWFLSADIPGAVWILALILTVLTCLWMENLLPIRGVCALFMLFPGELFASVRLCETSWRLTLVVFAYVCAVIGMFGMFYPWRIRQALAWRAASPLRIRALGAVFAALGALFTVLGACAAAGAIR